MTTKATRRSPKGDLRRQDILAAAEVLFAEGGFNATSLLDIAAKVGITQAGLLHHFPSKGELLIATLDAWENRNRAHQRASEATGLPWLNAFIETLRRNEENISSVRLYAIVSHESLAQDHPAHGWFRDRYARLIARTTGRMDDLIDPAKLPLGVTPETIARAMIAIADGMRLQWLLQPDDVDRPETMVQVFDLLRPYLRQADLLQFSKTVESTR